MRESMNPAELQEIWDLPGPLSVRPSLQGINNLTQIVETPAGNYILRTYDSDRHLEHVGYELSLLRELQYKNLPFQIPAPIPTLTGESFVIYSGRMITMTPLLSGIPPEGDNLEQAQVAGHALAELVKALADIQVEATLDVVPFPLSGDFEAWGKIDVGSVNSIIRQLPLPKEEQSQVLTLIEETQAATPSLYRICPVQIIHRDYDQSNILMQGNSVTGVLDFEFCGPDLRILDLAYALSQWPSGWWNTGKEWHIINIFTQGYLQSQMLPAEELETLPLVFRLRTVASLFYRFGRYARGLETVESLLNQVREALSFKLWLDLHEEQLLRQIRDGFR
jgi:homoserine kinase type II